MKVRTGSHFSALVAGASMKRSIAIAATKESGQVVAIANTEDTAVIVKRAVLHVKTASTGACTLDIGIAADATTSSDNLMDGLSTAGVPVGIYDNIENQGSNGRSSVYWPSGSYLTASVASGDANGLVADLYVDVQPLTGG